MLTIHQRIKLVRQDWHLNQKEFANKLGITNAHVSAIEKGKTMPSQALIKLISKEFLYSEHWITDGIEPMFSETVESQNDDIMGEITDRMNKIRTSNNESIRSRVIPIEKLFVDMVDLPNATEEQRIKYYDLFYKMFFHLNNYLDFHKQELISKQLSIFNFPDDLIHSLKNDIKEIETFFKKSIDE